MQNSKKNGIFWYKFAPRKKFWGSIEKLEYRCRTTNLPLCNGTIIIVKIKLLHSVSVITNFVILKRDEVTDRQKKSHFFIYSQRATHNRHQAWRDDGGGLCHFCIP